ncbi:MAG TPA: EamA family transporter [Chloroflexota bacterium]|jgi:drug/metabolite transporter (DMT)-like permease|nr:EamA family transporter [Chloroflexota bacterium]
MPSLGIVFSLFSAASFGINEAMTRRGMVGASASQGLYITVTFGVPAFLLASIVTGQFAQAGGISWLGLVWLGAAGIVHFLGGRYCNYRSIGAIGANRSQPLRSTALLYSVGFAVLILHENLTLGRALGVALLTAGALLMVDRKQNATAPGANQGTMLAASGGAAMAVAPVEAPTSTLTRLIAGYGFGLMAGLMYGISPIFIKLGLEGTNIGLFGGFVSYLAASVVLLSTLLRPGRWAYVRTMKQEHARWFLGSGTFVFLAQMFRYLALGTESVTLVSSLGQLNGIFTLGFSATVNRHLENFRRETIIGVVLSVIGGIAVAF